MNRQMRVREGAVQGNSATGRIVDAVIILLVLLIAFCSLVPLYHVFMASVSDGKALMGSEGLLLKPAGRATLDGYRNIFKDASILKGYANTLIYVLVGTLCCMFINITGAYVLSRDTKLKGVLTLMVVITAMFGGGLIPTYMVIQQLGWVGTRWALLIPGCTNSFFLVMMVAAYRNVPPATIEAAYIDGAGDIRMMLQVMLPQAMNVGIVIILNSVIMQWNSWFNASIYIPNKRDLWPLQLWIKQMTAENAGFVQSNNPDYSKYLSQFALSVIATVPILVAMPFFAGKMEECIVMGAVKE